MKVNMLRNADIHKVDLVTEGAQQLSKIEILKSKEGIDMDSKACKLDNSELDEIEGLLKTLKEKLGICDDDPKEGHDDKHENPEDKHENPEDKPVDKTENPDDKKDTKTENPDDKKDTKAEDTKDTKDTEDPVAKALAKAANAEAENSKLKEQIAKMAEERENKEFVEKAAGFKNIPGISESELGSVLKAVYKSAGKETYDKLESVLKSANETIGTGSIFVEKGSSSNTGAEPQTSDEAWSMLEEMAKNRVEKKLSSTSTCMADVLKTDEGEYLYAKYKELRNNNK